MMLTKMSTVHIKQNPNKPVFQIKTSHRMNGCFLIRENLDLQSYQLFIFDSSRENQPSQIDIQTKGMTDGQREL